VNLVWLGAVLYGVGLFLQNAYNIRMRAIDEYGPVIHEFDPYFNWRATQYLYDNGAKKFFTWFDHMVWYPLGRPVGSTIYPGMQFAAVWLKRYVLGDSMSLNDVCCYIPVWFGVAATFLVGCIAYEASLPQNAGGTIFGVVYDALRGRYASDKDMAGTARSRILGMSSPAVESAVFAMGFMAVVPAHLMRSVGGGYDNESVAVTAMTLTFYLWMRSLRNGDKYGYVFGVLAGVAYFNMAAAWGGYIFVLNLIGAHAAMLVLLGRFSTKTYLAYTLFYVVGTSLAIQIPVVGWSPLKSLEQLGAFVIFLGYQVLYYCELQRNQKKMGRKEAWKFRVQVFVGILALVSLLVVMVTPKGYFGPISSRVRGLFVPHTKTGNPLVDSVAEHQAASNQAYWQYLHILCGLAPAGFFIVLFRFGDSAGFLFVYALAAYFFSNKMVRLILLTAPIASVLGGIAVGRIVSWSTSVLLGEDGGDDIVKGGKKEKKKSSSDGNGKTKADGKKKKKSASSSSGNEGLSGVSAIYDGFVEASTSTEGKIVKTIAAVVLLGSLYMQASNFKTYSWKLSASLSNPSIILKGQTREGNIIKVDDYREAYWWLRDNTPEDARIMAWWDYGYQITGIANRTTIADGNTWNHEHIALLGKALTGSVDEGYAIARHLADYVLVWGGGGGDDLAKSPHLARIANSVYRDHCPGDVTCRAFGFVDRKGTPSAMMERSFLYNLHGNGIKPGVSVDPTQFQEIFRSKYGKVRIYKIIGVSRESKRWVEDNRKCDAGGWFCPGKYPPGLKEILDKKTDFAQLEDFNRGVSDEEYQKEYFENLNNPELARKRAELKRKEVGIKEEDVSKKKKEFKLKTLSDEEKIEIYSTWEDTEDTTLMWKIVNGNSMDDLERWLEADPGAAWLRSADGRGPMWWAFESKNQDVVTLLMKMGVPHTDKDKNGHSPVDLLKE